VSCICNYHAVNGVVTEPACRWCEAPLRDQGHVRLGFCGRACIDAFNAAGGRRLVTIVAPVVTAEEAA